MAQDVNKETQEMSEDPIAETHSEKEDARSKRVTKKPIYLKDCVRAKWELLGVGISHSD